MRVYTVHYDSKKGKFVHHSNIKRMVFKSENDAHAYLKSIGFKRIAASCCYESNDFDAYIEWNVLDFEIFIPTKHQN